MIIFADTGFAKTDWQPTNLRLCQRGGNVRMVVETVLSMLTYICRFKQMTKIGSILKPESALPWLCSTF